MAVGIPGITIIVSEVIALNIIHKAIAIVVDAVPRNLSGISPP
jgi:hypothetical protein